MKWLRLGLALSGAALLVTLALCHRHQQKQGDKPRLTIAVVPMAVTDEYWKAVHAGALDYADQHGIQIVWQGTRKYSDRAGQMGTFETVAGRSDGIVLAPLDDWALNGVIEDAWRFGIPVVVIDSPVTSRRPISVIATNNVQGGRLAAKRLIEKLGGHGRITMLRGNVGNASVAGREQGFLEVLDAFNGGEKDPAKQKIRLVNANLRVGSTNETAGQAAENLLQSLKSADGKLEVEGIFCPNEMSSFAMLRTLRETNLIRKVHFVGFDSSKQLNDALRAGEIEGLVVQNPYKMGFEGVKALDDYLSGRPYPQEMDTGAVLATPENANNPDIAALLEPDLRRTQ